MHVLYHSIHSIEDFIGRCPDTIGMYEDGIAAAVEQRCQAVGRWDNTVGAGHTADVVGVPL